MGRWAALRNGMGKWRQAENRRPVKSPRRRDEPWRYHAAPGNVGIAAAESGAGGLERPVGVGQAWRPTADMMTISASRRPKPNSAPNTGLMNLFIKAERLRRGRRLSRQAGDSATID